MQKITLAPRISRIAETHKRVLLETHDAQTAQLVPAAPAHAVAGRCGGFPVVLHAGVISYNVTLDRASHYFDPGFPFEGGNPTTYSQLDSSMALPLFTADVSADDAQLLVTFSAPEGKRIEIGAAPEGATGYTIRALLWSNDMMTNRVLQQNGASISFTGLSGTAPTPNWFYFDYDDWNGFSANVLFDQGGFSFTSMSMLFDVPDSYNRQFVNYPPGAAFIDAYAEFGRDYQGEEALELITLGAISVPEPSSFVLFGAGGALLLMGRIRKPRNR